MGKIELRGISKTIKNTVALKDVNLTFEENKIYGLLGRNGAGKSTMINIITNCCFADVGKVLIDGETAVENDNALSKVYCMSEKKLYPYYMKIKDIFKWSKNFYKDFDMEYALNLSKDFELNINKKVIEVSTGQSSLYKLIIALSVNTPYLIFDEPVLGLDANNRDLFYKKLLEKYIKKPCTMIISTHLIEEVSNIVEDIIIIKDGIIIENKSTEELLNSGYTATGSYEKIDKFANGKNIIGEDKIGSMKSVYILGKPEKVPDGIEITKLDLQKLFIKLTNS